MRSLLARAVPARLRYALALTSSQRADRRAAKSRLVIAKQDQLERFEARRSLIADVYAALRVHDVRPYVVPYWQRFEQQMARELLPLPTISFLRHPRVRDALVPTSAAATAELRELESRWMPSELSRLIEEEAVGDVDLLDGPYDASPATVEQLYHLTRFERATGFDLGSFGTVVEWGGGYGCLANIVMRLDAQAAIVMVDTPLVLAIQWLYLGSVLHPDRVRLATRTDAPRPGSILLVPVPLAFEMELRAHLFVSLWALSESTPYAQRRVSERAWFEARHLLIGLQGPKAMNPAARDPVDLRALLRTAGARSEPVRVHFDQFYAFR